MPVGHNQQLEKSQNSQTATRKVINFGQAQLPVCLPLPPPPPLPSFRSNQHWSRAHPSKVQTSPGVAAGLAMAPWGGSTHPSPTLLPLLSGDSCRHFVCCSSCFCCHYGLQWAWSRSGQWQLGGEGRGVLSKVFCALLKN